jgi:succinoglycan biosynthesis protein ExoA
MREPAEAVATGIDVSVLIPVLDEVQHIRDTAASMRAQDFAGEVEFLFIDGGSTDGTQEVLEELASDDERMRVLANPDRHIPPALNTGLRHARGRYVARMDAHTHYRPDYLRRGVERLRRGDVSWVSGAALPFGTGRWSRRVALALGTWLGVGSAGFRREAAEEFDSDTGFTGLWRRETLLRYGGWDEDSLVNEDAELAARMRKGGERIVCLPEMAARYVPRDSLGALARQYWRYGQFRARTSRLHPESLRRANLLPPGLAVALLVAPVAPRPVSRAARAGLATYALALVAAAVAGARRGSATDAATLPVVLCVMHLSWGLGFLVGSVRFGLPLAALARALGFGRRRA